VGIKSNVSKYPYYIGYTCALLDYLVFVRCDFLLESVQSILLQSRKLHVAVAVFKVIQLLHVYTIPSATITV